MPSGDNVRIHYQEELEQLEARALDGLDLVECFGRRSEVGDTL